MPSTHSGNLAGSPLPDMPVFHLPLASSCAVLSIVVKEYKLHACKVSIGLNAFLSWDEAVSPLHGDPMTWSCDGGDEIGHLCRKGVIVANAQLLNGHGVILVDHWHGAVCKELAESIAGIYVLPTRSQVPKRKQHLRARLLAQRRQHELSISASARLKVQLTTKQKVVWPGRAMYILFLTADSANLRAGGSFQATTAVDAPTEG